MGHGGTLDPLATGVLIVGIGRGTKTLGGFLECTKTYETLVLFGKSTDTYDVSGKVVADAPHSHLTRTMVEEKLAAFRGKIKQVPPVYSALRIDGMRAYEYARTGKELPRQLESRDMTVDECTLLDWYEGGQHDYRWPAAEASSEEKVVARKLMRGADTAIAIPGPGITISETADETKVPTQKPLAEGSRNPVRSPSPSRRELNRMNPSAKAALHTHEQDLSDQPADGPAARIRLTVSSGFYVRSFAYDLGISCGSFAAMAELLRSRQGDYTSIEPAPEGLVPCITYEELEKGEDDWGPKLTEVLQNWTSKHPVVDDQPRIDDRDKPDGWERSRERKEPKKAHPGHWRDHQNNVRGYRGSKRKQQEARLERRNSSSSD